MFTRLNHLLGERAPARWRGAGATVVRSSFDETKEDALQVALAGARAASAPVRG